MLETKTGPSGVSDLDTGQKIAEQTGQAYHCPAKTASIIQEVPKLVQDQQEDLVEESPTECEDDKLIDSLSECRDVLLFNLEQYIIFPKSSTLRNNVIFPNNSHSPFCMRSHVIVSINLTVL